MAKKIKGITIEIGGETRPLEKALSNVNKKTRDLQGELRSVERLLKLDPGNTELLAQKHKLLAESVNNTKDKLKTLKKAEKEVQEQFRQGKIGEEQYRLIQREVIATEQRIESLEKQLGEVNNKWKNAADGLDRFGKKATEIGKNMSMTVTAPVVAAGAAAFKVASDMEDAMGATEQIFGKSANSMKKWAKDLESYYGIASGEALEYGNMMGSMLQNIGGLTEEEAAKQAQTLIKLAGDLTAMYGGTTQDAVRALTGALKGNNTMLDNYGMAASDALIKTKAVEMGLISEGKTMDLATKQAATLALIMEQSGAAQGQAAREAKGASGSLRAMQTELKNLAGSLGEVILPQITSLLNILNSLMQRISKLNPATQKIIVLVAGIAAVIGPVLIALGMMAQGFGATIVAAGKLAVFIPKLGAVFTAITGPIGIVVAAIAGAVAIGVLLYKNWDAIKAGATELWSSITNTFDKIKTSISEKITAAKDTVKHAIDAIKGFFSRLKLPEIKIPKIKLPHFSITGEFSLKPPQVPKLGVEWYKTGGIFNDPSIIGVGEAGPEAVVPLDKLSGIISKAISSSGTTTVNHTGTIIHKGINDAGQLVAAVKQEFVKDISHDNRRIPNRVSVIPIG